jgi:hypothetical protein
MYQYTYQINSDFPNGLVSLDRLKDEVISSAITSSLESMGTTGNDCNIVFETELSEIDQARLDNLVAIHSGEPLPSGEVIVDIAVEKNEKNEIVVAPTHGHFHEAARFKGLFLSASGINTDTMLDYEITDQIYVHGGWFWTSGGACGDYLEFAVVDKNDVLGYFSNFGLTSGVDVLELGKYVETCYVSPDGTDMCHLQSPTIAPVAAGLFFRIKAHTTTSTPLCCGVTFLWFEV